MESETLEKVVVAARGGYPQAKEELCRFLAKKLLPWIKQKLPRPCSEEADDILGETLLLVLDGGLERIEDDRKIVAYARTIAKRILWRTKSLWQRNSPIENVPPSRIAVLGDQAAELDFKDLTQWLSEKLDRDDATLFLLEYVDDLSCREIALQLGFSMNVLACRRYALRKKLRKLISALYDNSPIQS